MPHAPSNTDRKRLSGALWKILLLLSFSVFINYIDRGNLSIAAPLLKGELGLSASQLGMLLSAFFWTYASCQLISGWLVDRFDVCRVMAAGFFLWSAATAVTAIVQTFAALFIVRLVLGMGESVAYPSYSKILAQHFPEDQRGFANALIAAGLACGPGFGMLLGGVLMARFGWRPFFLVLGLGSMLWLIPWVRWMPRRASGDAASEAMRVPSLAEFAQLRSAWGTCGGLFCSNYISYFLITWLPYYLVRERNFSMSKMAVIAGVSYFSAAGVGTLSGWLSDRWIDAGASPTRVRKTFTAGGMTIAAAFLVITVIAPFSLCAPALVCATIGFGICASNLWAITQTLAGPQAAGRWTGMQNFVGNLSGIVAPALTGFVLDRTGRFLWPFSIAGLVALLGATFWVFVVGRVEPVQWGSRARAHAVV